MSDIIIGEDHPTERQQFLNDIITTAVEGGIGYWSVVTYYRWQNMTEATAVIIDTVENEDYDENTERLRIDHGVIRKGISKATHPACHLRQDIKDIIKNASRQNDCAPDNEDSPGDIDAEIADCIVQLGLFDGEVRYG
jgi:hypothetical protein